MRRNGTIPIQDPSASPTFAFSSPAVASTSNAINTHDSVANVPPALRRNLFSSHLGRRPTSQETNTLTDPFQDDIPSMPPPPAQLRSHRSAPPAQIPQLLSQTSTASTIVQSQPTLSLYTASNVSTSRHQHGQIQVQQSPQPRAQAIYSHDYEPAQQRISPSRSLSPLKHSNSSSAIIATDPNGRAILPIMPVLPARLRISDDDEDGSDPDHNGGGDGYEYQMERKDRLNQEREEYYQQRETELVREAQERNHDLGSEQRLRRHQARHESFKASLRSGAISNRPEDPNSNLSQEHPHLTDLISTNSQTHDHHDLDRIENMLTQMQSLQRQRAQDVDTSTSTGTTTTTTTGHNTSSTLETPIDSIASRTRNRTRGPGTTSAQSSTQPSPAKHRRFKNLQNPNMNMNTNTNARNISDVLSPEENQELLDLITSSLRRKVHEAESEDWMFGDVGLGPMGTDGFGNSGGGLEVNVEGE